MIKKIVLGLPAAKQYIGRMQFLTKIDGEWAIYPVGALKSTVSTKVTFENLTVTSTKGSYNNGDYSLAKMFYYDNTATRFNTTAAGTLTIEFTEPLRVLKGIYYHQYTNRCTYIQIYDENGVLIYEDTDIKDWSLAASSTNAASTNYFYETTGLEVMKAYAIGSLGTIETNDVSHISNVYQIDKILVTQAVPENTELKYALSFDGRNTYRSYKDGEWKDIDLANIISDGMSKEEVEVLTEAEYSSALTSNRTLDIIVGMITNDENTTPSINKITIDYLKIV